jgi:hypothetical protein
VAWSSPPLVGSKTITTAVLSTSLNPSVAGYFAHKDPAAIFSVLKVGVKGPKGFAFNTRQNEKLGHEFEILVESGVTISAHAIHATVGRNVIECELEAL